MKQAGLMTAWLVGEGLVTYRVVKAHQRPPTPGELLYSSGLFVLLGLLGEAYPGLATLMAWGFDLAAFMNLAPQLGGSAKGPVKSTAGTAAGSAAGSLFGPPLGGTVNTG